MFLDLDVVKGFQTNLRTVNMPSLDNCEAQSPAVPELTRMRKPTKVLPQTDENIKTDENCEWQVTFYEIFVRVNT